MHACGHDAHIAIGITVARMLAARRDEFNGTVKLVFQPAEEGMGGAPSMMDDGVLENPHPDFAVGMHVWNDKPVGWLGVADGPLMAAAEIFKIRVTGKGGHGAAPHLAIDPVLASAQIISALQGIISRNVAPLDTAVITVATIHGGEAFNVIPPAVEMSGTIRTFDVAMRQRVLDRFDQVVHGVAEACECQAEIEMNALTPAVVNNASVAEVVRQTAAQILPDYRLETRFATMGSEDMAFFLQEIPGCFFFVGSANAEKGLNASHHHPRFDIDETVLPSAAALMAGSIVNLLG
jgi:amidohydrolase